MKLYTRTGDAGQTGLYGGDRVDKDAVRVEAYGTVDELNASLGLAVAACADASLGRMLTDLQSRLFDLGADLCTPAEAKVSRQVRIGARHIAELEQWIDAVCADLPPLKTFVLPGGTELAARLHLARTIARRAERRVVTLSRSEPVGEHVLAYLNRINDLLFALARQANHVAGVADVPWQAEA